MKVRVSLEKFETISENSKNQLTGGFSFSVSSVSNRETETLSNNCNGGNCISRCGSGQNIGCNSSAFCEKFSK